MNILKNKPKLQSLVLFTILTLLVACAPESKTVSYTPEKKGVSSGGGGYYNIHSKKLLEEAQKHLTAMILNSSPDVLSTLPTDFGKDKFIELIQNIRILDTESKKRKTDLMFDYFCEEKDGNRHYEMTSKVSDNGKSYFECDSGRPRIAALKLFFTIYADKDKKTIDEYSYNSYIRSVEDRILHEISHFIVAKSDEEENFNADFAQNFVKALDYDLVHCLWDKDQIPEEHRDLASFYNNEVVFSRGNTMLLNTYPGVRDGKFKWAIQMLDSDYRHGKIPVAINDKSFNRFRVISVDENNYLIKLVSFFYDKVDVLLNLPNNKNEKEFEATFSMKIQSGEEFKTKASCETYPSVLEYEYP